MHQYAEPASLRPPFENNQIYYLEAMADYLLKSHTILFTSITSSCFKPTLQPRHSLFADSSCPISNHSFNTENSRSLNLCLVSVASCALTHVRTSCYEQTYRFSFIKQYQFVIRRCNILKIEMYDLNDDLYFV